MQGSTPAVEPAAEPPQQKKKPSALRARKATTPRSRAKKPADGKKAATPRRRASPRNRKAAQDAETKKKEKDTEKEKNKDEKENAVETVQAAPPVVVASSSSLPTVKEENDGEEGEDMKQETKVEKTEMGNQQEAEAGEELLPAQDTQLRRTYLQRMYRQLQSTHPNQDDAMIRQIATNVEMEACQKSATRSQYVAAMDHEIHKLMQFELEQANAPVYTNDAAPSYQSEQSATVQGQQPAVSSEMQSGYSQNQISQSHSYEYAQALAKAQEQEQEQEQANNSARSSSFSTPRQSMNSGDMSFQSLMDNQSQGGYGRDSMQQQQQQQNTPTRLMSMQNLQQMGNQYYSTSSVTTPTSQSYSVQSNVSEMAGQKVPRNMMEAHQHQQLGNYQMQQQQQQMHTPGSMRPPSRVTTFQEFTAQIQHLDKSVLIELLWNQRSALARWQNHAKQLELQVSAHQTAASHMGSSPGFQSPYNSPMVGGAAFVSPNIAAEAEMQRARERNSSRMPQLPRHHQQQQMPQYPSYSQQSTPSSATYSQADGSWGDNNPPLYWQRIRQLKSEYEEQLRTAQRALAQNTVPPNSMYSAKAQSMMQNITMVLNILNEPPTNVQPRKLEVLSSIEHFMHQSVTPIVRKVLSSGATVSPATVTAGSSPSMTTSVATFSPSAPLSQGSVVGVSSSFRQGSDNQYNGARWASSNPSFSEVDTSRQHSRGIFADVDAGDANGSTRMMDGLTAVGNSPCNATYEPTGYAQVRAENDAQSDTSMGQSMVYEAPSMALKESSTLSLPALESRPSTIPDSRLSPDDPGNARDSNSSKVMDSASVDDDFSDFPVLEFEDPVADGNSFVKENNPSNVSRKRGIEDV